MAKILTVSVNSITAGSSTTVLINYSWAAVDGGTTAVDSGEVELSADLLSNVLNSSVIADAVSRAGVAGVTIGVLDRKIILGGFA